MIPKTNPTLAQAVADCDLPAKNLDQMDLRRRGNDATSRTGNISLAAMKGSICALQSLVDDANYGQNTSVGWDRRYTGAVRWISNVNTKDELVSYDPGADRLRIRIGMVYTSADQTMSALIYGYCDQPGTLEVKWTKQNNTTGNFEIIAFQSGYLEGPSKPYEMVVANAGQSYVKTYTFDPAYPYLMLIPRTEILTSASNGATNTCYYKSISARLI